MDDKLLKVIKMTANSKNSSGKKVEVNMRLCGHPGSDGSSQVLLRGSRVAQVVRKAKPLMFLAKREFFDLTEDFPIREGRYEHS